MIYAKLFLLGQERELLWADTFYNRETRKNGKPATEVLNGLLSVGFVSQESDEILLNWISKDSEDDSGEEKDKMIWRVQCCCC